MPFQTKSALRQFYRERNQAATPAMRQAAGLAAAQRVETHPLFINSQHIACYLACSSEFDTTAIMAAIWRAHKHCYVPVVNDRGVMQFVRYDQEDAITYNRYGIAEPVHQGEPRMPECLDLVFCPLVAFDRLGHRLGSGGGYYDRYFAFLKNAVPLRQPVLLGLGYAWQEAIRLPNDPWDIRLAGILTEKELITDLRE